MSFTINSKNFYKLNAYKFEIIIFTLEYFVDRNVTNDKAATSFVLNQ